MSTPRFDVEGVAVSGDHFIGGHRVASPSTFANHSPLDWERDLGAIARGDAEAADAAVAAAVSALRRLGRSRRVRPCRVPPSSG